MASPKEKSENVGKDAVAHISHDMNDGAEDDLGIEAQSHRMKRGLKSRHIQLIALGGAIGTGLFVGSGLTLSTAGPASLFIAYCIMCLLIVWIMNALAEMSCWLPLDGATVPWYTHRFFDPSLAFASGWNYWYSYAILVAAEISASATIIQYWIPADRVPVAVWITIILAIILGLNIFVVSAFGEAEFWFASIKLLTIFGLIVVGIVIVSGGGPRGEVIGFYYWRNPGPFVEYKATGLAGQFCGWLYALVHAGFAFILSPELISTTAGEAEAPRRNIPKAASRFVYRLAFFYGLGSLIISMIVPSNDPKLISAVNSGQSDAGASPFVLGIQNAGIPVLNHIVNAAILTSAASAGNAFLYAASRNLYSLALDRQAPSFCKKVNKQGVPYMALLVSAAIACLSYLSVSRGSTVAFNWFVSLTTISGFIAWIVLGLTYLRFRKALIYQGEYADRPYQTRFQPHTTYIFIITLTILSLVNGFDSFFPQFSIEKFLAAYITIPVFLVLYFGHKAYHRGPWIINIQDIDIMTGKAEADEEELKAGERRPARNLFEKYWFWIA